MMITNEEISTALKLYYSPDSVRDGLVMEIVNAMNARNLTLKDFGRAFKKYRDADPKADYCVPTLRALKRDFPSAARKEQPPKRFGYEMPNWDVTRQIDQAYRAAKLEAMWKIFLDNVPGFTQEEYDKRIRGARDIKTHGFHNLRKSSVTKKPAPQIRHTPEDQALLDSLGKGKRKFTPKNIMGKMVI